MNDGQALDDGENRETAARLTAKPETLRRINRLKKEINFLKWRYKKLPIDPATFKELDDIHVRILAKITELENLNFELKKLND